MPSFIFTETMRQMTPHLVKSYAPFKSYFKNRISKMKMFVHLFGNYIGILRRLRQNTFVLRFFEVIVFCNTLLLLFSKLVLTISY